MAGLGGKRGLGWVPRGLGFVRQVYPAEAEMCWMFESLLKISESYLLGIYMGSKQRITLM